MHIKVWSAKQLEGLNFPNEGIRLILSIGSDACDRQWQFVLLPMRCVFQCTNDNASIVSFVTALSEPKPSTDGRRTRLLLHLSILQVVMGLCKDEALFNPTSSL